MKRAIGLAIVTTACIIAFVAIRVAMPFTLVIIALAILALLLYGKEINRVINRLHRGFFSPVLNEEKLANQELSRKIETAEKKMDITEQALLQFSSAIADYARHLASHTSAIRGLSEASQELKKGAAEQNRVLSALIDNISKSNQPTPVEEIPMITQKQLSPVKKSEAKNIPQFHRALYRAMPVKPAIENNDFILAVEKVKTNDERPATTKKQVFKSENPAPELADSKTIRLVPVADKIVIQARKSVQPAEKPTPKENLHPHFPSGKPVPPGCARWHQESLWT